MRLHEVISEDFDLEEGPIWDKTRQVGAAIGKGIGAVGQGIGAVAGVPAGIARSIKKGYNRASDTIAGGPDETPQQGGTQYQPSGQQSAAGQAQAVAGQSAEDPATLRKQARDLMARADEIERQQKQTSQSAPSQQTTQPNQSTGNATSGQQASQAQPNQTQQASQAQPNQTQQASQAQPNQTQQASAPETPADNVSTPSSTNGQINQTSTGLVHKADPNNPNNKQSTSAKPNADVTDVEPKTKSTTNPLSLPAPTQQKSKRNPNYTDAEMKAHQDAGGTYDDETGKMIPLQRAGGSYNNQIGNGKANYGVTTRFDPNTMKNVSKPLNSKAVNVVPNTTNPTTSSQDQTAKLRSNLAASQKARAASKFDSNQEYAKEGIQYYSRFLRGMI